MEEVPMIKKKLLVCMLVFCFGIVEGLRWARADNLKKILPMEEIEESIRVLEDRVGRLFGVYKKDNSVNMWMKPSFLDKNISNGALRKSCATSLEELEKKLNNLLKSSNPADLARLEGARRQLRDINAQIFEMNTGTTLEERQKRDEELEKQKKKEELERQEKEKELQEKKRENTKELDERLRKRKEEDEEIKREISDKFEREEEMAKRTLEEIEGNIATEAVELQLTRELVDIATSDISENAVLITRIRHIIDGSQVLTDEEKILQDKLNSNKIDPKIELERLERKQKKLEKLQKDLGEERKNRENGIENLRNKRNNVGDQLVRTKKERKEAENSARERMDREWKEEKLMAKHEDEQIQRELKEMKEQRYNEECMRKREEEQKERESKEEKEKEKEKEKDKKGGDDEDDDEDDEEKKGGGKRKKHLGRAINWFEKKVELAVLLGSPMGLITGSSSSGGTPVISSTLSAISNSHHRHSRSVIVHSSEEDANIGTDLDIGTTGDNFPPSENELSNISPPNSDVPISPAIIVGTGTHTSTKGKEEEKESNGSKKHGYPFFNFISSIIFKKKKK
jgi:hypothetical protein